MTVKTGSAWAGSFVTLDATGALATPSTGPAGVLYVDGASNGASVTITGTNPYKWSVTLPSLTAGQRVDMYITATIATIATAGFVASEQADTSILSDGVTLADDAITSAKFDESTAFPVKYQDASSTKIARTGADSDTLETLSDQIDTVGSAAGSGATTKVYTVTDSSSGLPIADVNVWVTTDAAGSNIVASGDTNASGQVTFYLDSGTTYYIWRQKAGYNFTNPDSETA